MLFKQRLGQKPSKYRKVYAVVGTERTQLFIKGSFRKEINAIIETSKIINEYMNEFSDIPEINLVDDKNETKSGSKIVYERS